MVEQRQARRWQPAELRLIARAGRVALHRLRVADDLETCGEIKERILFTACDKLYTSFLPFLSFSLAICAASLRAGCMRAASFSLFRGLPEIVREWRVHVCLRVSENNDAGM